ncbi:MAG: ribokinase, partial [Propionicimonas sp.]
AVGEDAFGERLLVLMGEEGIDPRGVGRVGCPTGTAHITVDAVGQNSIVVVPGANQLVGPERVRAADPQRTGWLVTQLELPLETVAGAIEWARASGARTVLTPAPARALTEQLLRQVDLLVPNEIEACQLTGLADPIAAACELSLWSGDVVVTLGSGGSAWAHGGRVVHRQPARPVGVVDTTAAGDTFVGVLVARLAAGDGLEDAIRSATVAASIAVGRPGATDSMPTLAEIEAVSREGA